MRARIYAHFSSIPLAQSAAGSLKDQGCALYALQIISNPCPPFSHRPFVGGSLFPACSPSANTSWPLAVPEIHDPASFSTLPAAVSSRRPKDGVTLMIQTDGCLASPAAWLLKSCGGKGISIF
nr:hypothetical protein [uncultured Solibaculum sp.]